MGNVSELRLNEGAQRSWPSEVRVPFADALRFAWLIRE